MAVGVVEGRHDRFTMAVDDLCLRIRQPVIDVGGARFEYASVQDVNGACMGEPPVKRDGAGVAQHDTGFKAVHS